MSALRAALDDYLRIRRQLGFAMPQDGRTLAGFVEFLDRAGAQRITTELALAWARLPGSASASARLAHPSISSSVGGLRHSSGAPPYVASWEWISALTAAGGSRLRACSSAARKPSVS